MNNVGHLFEAPRELKPNKSLKEVGRAQLLSTPLLSDKSDKSSLIYDKGII